MTATPAKTSSAMIPLIITALIAIAGWISYFFAQQEAAQFQQQAELMSLKSKPQIDEQQNTLPAKQTPEKQTPEKQTPEKQAPEKQEAASPTPAADLTQTADTRKAPPQAEASEPPRKFNRMIMAEREKALKERDAAQARIGSVLKQKEHAIEEGKQLKEQLAQAAADVEKLKQDMEMIRQQETDRFQKLRQQLEQELEQKQVTISQLKNRMTVVNVTAEILFSSGSAVIKPKGQKVLDLIAETLNKYPDRMISIEGHTDNVPIAGELAYQTNWELSSARAAAAVRYLEDNAGVNPARMQVVGHGQHQPAASNETVEGRAANRRIEIILLPPSKP